MEIKSSDSMFILPDVLVNWPWKRNINPHFLEVQAESTAWIQSVIPFTPCMQQAIEVGNFSLLAALAYPFKSKDALRAAIDIINFTFLLDDTIEAMKPPKAQQIHIIVMDAIRNSDQPRPVGESVIGEASRQLWQSLSQFASVGEQRRFIEMFDKYVASIVQQAQDYAENTIRTIDEYILLRRDTSAIKPQFVFLEFGLNIPDEVFEDPVIQRLANACIDIIMLSNDMYSYNVEQARGDGGHNIVTVVMQQKALGLNEALRWIGNYISKLTCNFLDDLNYAPFFGRVQGEVEFYLRGLANWVKANECWSFETGRYFGESRFEIQQSRRVVLLPRSGALMSQPPLCFVS